MAMYPEIRLRNQIIKVRYKGCIAGVPPKSGMNTAPGGCMVSNDNGTTIKWLGEFFLKPSPFPLMQLTGLLGRNPLPHLLYTDDLPMVCNSRLARKHR